MELTEKVLDRLKKQLKTINVNQKKMIDKRPILKEMHYTEDGDLEFTNSYVAVRLTSCHEEKNNIPEYPNLKRLFDIGNQGSTIELNTKDMTNILSPFKKEKQDSIIINFTKNEILFASTKPEDFFIREARLDVKLDIEEPFYVNADPVFLYDCFNFFRLLKIETIEMTYSSPVRPMFFKFENLEYLVTPRRSDVDLKIKSRNDFK